MNIVRPKKNDIKKENKNLYNKIRGNQILCFYKSKRPKVIKHETEMECILK